MNDMFYITCSACGAPADDGGMNNGFFLCFSCLSRLRDMFEPVTNVDDSCENCASTMLENVGFPTRCDMCQRVKLVRR